MNTTISVFPIIDNISFLKNDLLISLSNDRIFIVPLQKFPVIANLTAAEKNNFEIIDGKYLSFTSIDEVFSINELIGV